MCAAQRAAFHQVLEECQVGTPDAIPWREAAGARCTHCNGAAALRVPSIHRRREKQGAVDDARFQVIAQSAQTVPVPEYQPGIQPAGVSIKRQSDPIGPSTPCERGSAESS